ncbi:hypothetical protein HAX54_014811, partial [Datura stramonium]|nr:hypothetical protein [Datura stramonium]
MEEEGTRAGEEGGGSNEEGYNDSSSVMGCGGIFAVVTAEMVGVLPYGGLKDAKPHHNKTLIAISGPLQRK